MSWRHHVISLWCALRGHQHAGEVLTIVHTAKTAHSTTVVLQQLCRRCQRPRYTIGADPATPG